MSTRRALVHKSQGIAEVRNIPRPKLQDDYIIVKTKAIALNPTDWKTLHKMFDAGAIVGCDYAGIVEEVGKSVTVPFNPGDRVAGFLRGGDPYNHDNGAFADRITAKGDVQGRISDKISFEDAATLGCGVLTVGQGLYQTLGLPLPPEKVKEPTYILIYGGSTATGTLAIQYAKLSGLTVIATSSPHNFELLRSLGADEVYDYKDPDVGPKIRKATDDGLRLVFDTISEHSSSDISAAALSSKGGHVALLLPVKDFPRDDVKVTRTLAYTALGEKFNEDIPASKDDYDFGVKFWRVTEELVNSGQLKPHPKEVRSGGLEAVSQGLQDLKDNKVSGVKLVYNV